MDYTVQELIHNQSFRRMVKGEAGKEEIDRWNLWIEVSDENRQKAKQATTEIVGFEFKGLEAPNIAAEWNRLRKVTVSKKRKKSPVFYRRNDGMQWLYRVAAVILLAGLTVVGIYIYYQNTQHQSRTKQISQAKTIKTGTNEQKTIAFSDGSKIILNSNSKITYQLGVYHNHPTKVILQGEAYFEAVKNKAEFAVYTPDGIIRDVGTKFLVTVQKNVHRWYYKRGKWR